MNVEHAHEKERALSCFFCRELFPLYIEDKLDTHRREQIEKHVHTCASCRHLLDKIVFSKKVLGELSKTKPTESLVNYIRKEQSFWSETFEKVEWNHWPSTLQWAVQLSLVAVILVTGIHFFPWLKFARRLHEIQRNAAPLIAVPPSGLTASDDDSSKAADDDVKLEADKPQGPAATPVATTAVAGASAKNAPDATFYGPAIPETLRQAAETTAVENAATGTAGPVVPLEVAKDEPKPDASKMPGFVWKGTLKVDSISDDVAGRVTKIVTDLGGVKAGQVELGWHRGNQRYYHFILPDDNYDRLLSALNREGIVQLTKESHPRVIKQGHMRIIMTIEENE